MGGPPCFTLIVFCIQWLHFWSTFNLIQSFTFLFLSFMKQGRDVLPTLSFIQITSEQ